jgi:hypothetical protein
MEGIDDGRRRTKIHVGHPQWNYIPIQILVPLHAGGITPLNRYAEIKTCVFFQSVYSPF